MWKMSTQPCSPAIYKAGNAQDKVDMTLPCAFAAIMACAAAAAVLDAGEASWIA
jgi:hypothetical protein